MPSPLETALAGLLGVLESVPGAAVLRNANRPEAAPASAEAGLIVLRDGQRLNETEMFSPFRVAVEHGAVVEVHASDEGARDDLVEAVRAEIAADRTLGGAVEYARVASREDAAPDVAGAEAARSTALIVALSFLEDG